MLQINAIDYNLDEIDACHKKGEIFIPFYRDENTTPSLDQNPEASTTTTDLDNVLNQPTGQRVCFSCSEVLQVTRNERQQLLKQHLTCQQDDDCTGVWAETPFQGGCPSPTNLTGFEIVESWARKWRQMLTDDTNQVQFHHNTCGYATPMCLAQSYKCIDNICQGVAKHLAEHHYTELHTAVENENSAEGP